MQQDPKNKKTAKIIVIQRPNFKTLTHTRVSEARVFAYAAMPPEY
jgi:hypothetical protein